VLEAASASMADSGVAIPLAWAVEAGEERDGGC